MLPGRHVLVLNDTPARRARPPTATDYAFLSLDAESRIVAWYAGAERIYGYQGDEIIGQHASCLYLDDDEPRASFHDELKQTAAEGHCRQARRWHKKKDGSRFWANSLTTALQRPTNMELQGFARVVRDFSARHRDGGSAAEQAVRRRGRLAR